MDKPDLAWRKSRHSGAHSHCVAVAADRGDKRLHTRDSVDPAGTVLVFTQAGWRAFIREVAG
jgi:hypothetical protein